MNHIACNNINWTKVPFKSISDAVAAEVMRTAVGAKFLPTYGPIDSSVTDVPADIIVIDKPNKTMRINQHEQTPINEIMVQFMVTSDQISEDNLDAIMILGSRAANLLAQAHDLVFFLGSDATTAEFFKNNPQVFLGHSGFPFPDKVVGLLNPQPSNRIAVRPKRNTNGSDGIVKYGEHTSSAVSQAYSLLQRQGHNGPYALVLHSDIYADTIESLEDTLIMPADRIKFFVTEKDSVTGKDEVRFYGTGALPPFTGLFMSLGGDTMDAVVTQPPSIRYSRTEGAETLAFEVYERCALRLKDPTAVVQLDFEQQQAQ